MHTLRITDEQWSKAKAIGERQSMPVKANRILTELLKSALLLKDDQIQELLAVGQDSPK